MKYKVNAGATQALTAATAKIVVAVDMSANSIGEISELRLATQSANGSDGPMLVEVCRAASFAGGTPGAALTPVAETPGHSAAARFSAVRGYSEGAGAPTITGEEVIEERLVPVQGEVEFVLHPTVKRWMCAAGGVLYVRVTAPQGQNIRAGADILD